MKALRRLREGRTMPRWLKITGIGCGGLVILGVLFIVLLVALVPTDTMDSAQGGGSEQAENSGKMFTTENYGQLFSDPDAHTGARVDITGQLLGPPERSGGEIVLQMFVDPENAEWNTVVYAGEGSVAAALKSDDYVRVKGSV